MYTRQYIIQYMYILKIQVHVPSLVSCRSFVLDPSSLSAFMFKYYKNCFILKAGEKAYRDEARL